MPDPQRIDIIHMLGNSSRLIMRVLNGFLSEYPVLPIDLSFPQTPVSEINEIMAEDGIGSKTAQRAKTRLGAVQEYVDGVPVRLLPGD